MRHNQILIGLRLKRTVYFSRVDSYGATPIEVCACIDGLPRNIFPAGVYVLLCFLPSSFQTIVFFDLASLNWRISKARFI